MEGTRVPVTLLSLADELLLSIIDNLDTPEDLRSLATTCSKLAGLTEPHIWRSLLVCNGEQAGRLVGAFKSRPERVSFVHDLAVCYSEETEEGVEDLDPYVPQMDRLRHLKLETPCPNNFGRTSLDTFTSTSRINYTELFEQCVSQQLTSPSLALLQSVTLHDHQSHEGPLSMRADAFSFGRTSAIFFHPTLRNLTISCTNFHGVTLADISPSRLKSTALQTLTFIESNVYLSFLEVALSLPQALRELSINERLYASDGCYPIEGEPTTMNIEFLDVLQIVGPSLKRLVHNPGNASFKHEVVESLSSVPPQEIAEKGQSFPLLEYLETSSLSPLRFILPQCHSLKTWRLNDSDVSVSDYYNGMLRLVLHAYGVILSKAIEAAIDRNNRPIDVDICFTAAGKPWQRRKAWWTEQIEGNFDRRSKVYRLATILKARGSRCRVLTETFGTERASFIPPYLQGEPTPWDECIYDSDRCLWTFDGKCRQTEDQKRLSQNLRAMCIACRKAKTFCRNKGYGTDCSDCAEASEKCEYPPMHSPWVVSA